MWAGASIDTEGEEAGKGGNSQKKREDECTDNERKNEKKCTGKE